jgi:hypothetical protein
MATTTITAKNQNPLSPVERLEPLFGTLRPAIPNNESLEMRQKPLPLTTHVSQ